MRKHFQEYRHTVICLLPAYCRINSLASLILKLETMIKTRLIILGQKNTKMNNNSIKIYNIIPLEKRLGQVIGDVVIQAY